MERKPSPWLFYNKSPANDLFLDSIRSFFFSFIKMFPMLTIQKTKTARTFFGEKSNRWKEGCLSRNFVTLPKTARGLWIVSVWETCSVFRNKWYLIHCSLLIAICVTSLHRVPKIHLNFKIYHLAKQLKNIGGRRKILIAICN